MKTKALAVIATVSLFVLAVAACGGGSTPPAARPATSDPAAVITAIQARQNAGDVDGVMALVADNAVFYNAPGQAGGPKLDTRAGIRAWVQRQVDTSTMAETSDIKVNGDTVTVSVKATRGGSVIHQGQKRPRSKTVRSSSGRSCKITPTAGRTTSRPAERPKHMRFMGPRPADTGCS